MSIMGTYQSTRGWMRTTNERNKITHEREKRLLHMSNHPSKKTPPLRKIPVQFLEKYKVLKERYFGIPSKFYDKKPSVSCI